MKRILLKLSGEALAGTSVMDLMNRQLRLLQSR